MFHRRSPAEFGFAHEQHRPANPAWAWSIVIIIGMMVWAVFLPKTFAHNAWIYSWDSAAYIETAESLLAGRGLMQRVIQGFEPEIWQPTNWWPPGYPILIAAVQLFGISGTTSCVVVAVVAGALSLLLVTIVYLRLFHWSLALPMTIAVGASVPFQKISSQCMSDTSYFAFAVASALCLIMWSTSLHASRLWIFGAGLFAGAAWVTRNVGLALFAATGLFFLAHYWSRLDQLVKHIGSWLMGVSVCGLPLLIYNLVTFGRLTPYEMPASELTLLHNVRRAVSVVVNDMTGAWLFGQWFRILVFAVALMIVLAVTYYGSKRSSFVSLCKRLPYTLARHQLQIFLLAYALFYSAVVIAARTRYRWGEEIDPRHMVQIYWALWICLAMWGIGLLATLNVSGMLVRVCPAAVFCFVAALQAFNQWHFIAQSVVRLDTVEGGVGASACSYLKGAVTPQQIVLSTDAHILRIYCDVNARKIPPIAQYYVLDPLTRADIRRLGDSGFLWGLVVENTESALEGKYDALVKEIIKHPERFPELRRVPLDSPAVVLKYVKE
jgi:hypothetical protein